MKTRFNNTEDTVAPAVLTNTKVNKAINLRKMVAVHLSLYNTFFLNNLKEIHVSLFKINHIKIGQKLGNGIKGLSSR